MPRGKKPPASTRSLLDLAFRECARQIAAGKVRVSMHDVIRLIRERERNEESTTRHVTVGWIDDDDDEEEPTTDETPRPKGAK